MTFSYVHIFIYAFKNFKFKKQQTSFCLNGNKLNLINIYQIYLVLSLVRWAKRKYCSNIKPIIDVFFVLINLYYLWKFYLCRLCIGVSAILIFMFFFLKFYLQLLTLSRLKRDYKFIIFLYLLCNMSLGLCALFKIQNVLNCKVKFAIVTILQLQKIEKSYKNT